MRLVFCAILVLAGLICKAQDDMPDLRSKRENLTKIPEKDIQSDVAIFSLAGLDFGMGRPPLRSMSIAELNNSFVKFDSANIHITVKAVPFTVDKYKMQYSEKYLIRINNKPYFGSYSKVPKMAVSAVNVVIDEDTVAIPATAYNDLFDPNFTVSGGGKSYDAVYFSDDKHTMYIYLLCNDNMGGYEVTWVIRDKKYVRRIVDFNVIKNYGN